MPDISVRLDLVGRIHGGTVLRGIAVDEKLGKLESHIPIGMTGTPPWPFLILRDLTATPLASTSASAADCAAALNTRLGTLSPGLGASTAFSVGVGTHYWTGTRWQVGTSSLAFQHRFLILQQGFGGMAPYEQQLSTGQGTLTDLKLDFVVVMSPA